MEANSIVLAVRFAVGGLLALAATGKLIHYAAFNEGLRRYQLLPDRSIPLAGAAVVTAEAATGLALVSGYRLDLAAPVSLVLFVTFLIAIAVNLIRGRELDCHCFEVLGTERIGAGSLVRVFVLVGFAALLVVNPPTTRGPIDWTLSVFAAVGIALLVLQIGGLGQTLEILRRRPVKAVPDGRRVSLKYAPLAPVFSDRVASRGRTTDG